MDGREEAMLFVVVLLVVLWALGLVTKATLGGLLHILLVVAIVLGLVSFIGRRVLQEHGSTGAQEQGGKEHVGLKSELLIKMLPFCFIRSPMLLF
jgi:hypothetical protein